MTRWFRKNWRYGCYVLRHKWYVALAGLERGVSPWRLLVHDLSKFRRDEWAPYAEWFYGFEGGSWHAVRSAKGLIQTTEAQTGAAHPESPLGRRLKAQADFRYDAFMLAFLRHLHRNDHHQQWWVLPGQGDKPPVAFEMPEQARREMLADWDGAGRAITGKKGGTPAWWAKNGPGMLLHPVTRLDIEHAMALEALGGP